MAVTANQVNEFNAIAVLLNGAHEYFSKYEDTSESARSGLKMLVELGGIMDDVSDERLDTLEPLQDAQDTCDRLIPLINPFVDRLTILLKEMKEGLEND